jgi:hypothetical protein
MFHLRRGPLLGTLLQHPDDIALAQRLFLTAPLDAALRQMMPVLCELVATPANEGADVTDAVALQVRQGG